MIRYYVDVPAALHARATHALRLLLEGEGIVSAPASEVAEADLVYAPPTNSPASSLHLHADIAAWERGPVDPLASESHDLVADAFGVASGAWEDSQVKNDFGVPSIVRSGAEVRQLVASPFVSRLCGQLLRLVQTHAESRNRDVETVPRWPGDSRFAICLTHDVDRPLSRPPAAHYRARIRRYLADSDFVSAGRGAMGYIRNVLLAGDSGKRPEADPQFGFDTWMQAEEQLGIRSAYYIAVRGSAEVGSHPRDVYYDASHPAIVAAIRDAADRGFEVGLHASIRCREEPSFLEEERDRLSALLGGRQVRGIRHHYLALDSDRPERTLAEHERAGFAYDSSLGLNEAAGFRRGLAWPFIPFDRTRDVELGITQVPLTAMDMAIFRSDVTREAAVADLEVHLNRVADAGGCAVLNWHLAQADPGRLGGAGPALLEALKRRRMGAADAAWWATPSEVVEWWQARRSRVFP